MGYHIVSAIRATGQRLPLRLACRIESFSNPTMKLSQIQAMIAVADAGSIRSAAKVLGKAQSAFTKQIRQVEEETGLALSLRTSRGVIPTEAGIAVLSRVRSIQVELVHLDDEVAALRGTNSGKVRVSATPLAAANILPRAIARFRRRFPDVDVTISDMFGDALKALREGQHDVVIGPHADVAKAADIEREALEIIDVVVIEQAMEAGSYEVGVETVLADPLVIAGRETLYEHPGTSAAMELAEIVRRDRLVPLSADAALEEGNRDPGTDCKPRLIVNTRSKLRRPAARAVAHALGP